METKKETSFIFNVYTENKERKTCEIQITGRGDRDEMVRLHNLLLENGFHIFTVDSHTREIPIIN